MSLFLCSNICKSFWIWERWQQQPFEKAEPGSNKARPNTQVVRGSGSQKTNQENHKKLREIKYSAEYKHFCLPGNGFYFLQIKNDVYLKLPCCWYFLEIALRSVLFSSLAFLAQLQWYCHGSIQITPFLFSFTPSYHLHTVKCINYKCTEQRNVYICLQQGEPFRLKEKYFLWLSRRRWSFPK